LTRKELAFQGGQKKALSHCIQGSSVFTTNERKKAEPDGKSPLQDKLGIRSCLVHSGRFVGVFDLESPRLGIPVKMNGDSSRKPNGVPLKANSHRTEATLAG
jgi:hypothetical protein